MTTLARRLPSPTDLTHYDPEQGLKRIAVASAAEKHFARAKDPTRLVEAIHAKLEAQAEFVRWYDTQAEKDRGARGDKRPNAERGIRSDTTHKLGENGLPDKLIVSRWRKLTDPATLERAFADICAQYPKLIEFERAAPHVSHNSGDNEWYTPAEYLEAVRAVLGAIDLDPASSAAANAVVKAERFFSIEENGLEQPWGGRIFLNPPYGRKFISHFCKKLAASVEAGAVTEAIVLVNNATDTAWFHRVASVAVAVCFPRRRIRFGRPDKAKGKPLQGQAVLYCGPHVERFREAFSPFGLVWVRP